MNTKRTFHLITALLISIGGAVLFALATAPSLNPPPAALAAPPTPPHSHTPTLPMADSPISPTSPVKLIFIHHSCGGNWLADIGQHDQAGGLGQALMNNNYFVSATNYQWGLRSDPGDPDSAIGSRTDIVNWPEWFTGPNRDTIMSAVYTETGQNIGGFGDWARMADPNPGDENEIIMFKSCFPNSDLYGNPDDDPLPAPNDYDYTVANAKAVYNDILTYFTTRQDKLFIVITAPPMAEGKYTVNDPGTPAADRAANARAFNNWLVNDWLVTNNYTYTNVAVFDYYNVLTSNGSPTRIDDTSVITEPNDFDLRPNGNHHYWNGSEITHTQTISNDFSAYPSYSGGVDDYYDSHPMGAGQQKATAEFVPLLNVFYNRWKSDAAPPPSLTLVAPNSSTSWPVSSSQQIQWTTVSTVSHVNLYYAIDDVTTTIVLSLPNTNSCVWITPPTPTTSARVRVESVFSPTTVYDVSDPFTLRETGAFTATVYLPLVLRDYTPQPPPCPHPLTGVTINGPTSGSLVVHTFTAVITPSDATTPITYTWSPIPASGQGTASASYQWTTTGTYTITLEVKNCGGTFTDTHTIVISEPTAGLNGFHRSGQTFLTWNEDTGVSGEGYHVYRHTAPINTGNLDQATCLTEKWDPLPEGSSIFYTDRDREPSGSAFTGLQNYVITDLGEPLTDTIGLFVWTSKEAGDFYYAVTIVQDSTETLNSENSLTSPVVETIADPEPVLVWQSSSGNGRVYTQFMDLATFNPTFERPYEHPDGGLQYAYNYFVGLPTTEQCDGPLPTEMPIILHIEGYGSRYVAEYELGNNSSYFCALEIWGDDPRQSWYYGFSASYDYRTDDPTTDTPDSGPIVNYAEERLLRSIYDTLRDPDYSAYNLDPQRVYVYGHSMGGSGALALAMRYPNVFAASFSSEPMTNYRTSGDGGGTNWRADCEPKWGTITASLPISNVGRYAGHLATYDGAGVWDWQNHQAQLVSRRGDEMAHISLYHGTLDNVIEWSTQGQPAYEPFYQGRRAFSGATLEAGHTWVGFEGLGPTVGDNGGPFYGFSVKRDETIPALSYASGSGSVPPPGPNITYNMNLEWSASWDDWDGPPVDTATEWRISLRTTAGPSQTVDVTPRRVQTFTITPGASYTWENRRVSDDGLVASGAITVTAEGLITVTDFAVSAGGNRLILRPAGGVTSTRNTAR